MPFSASKTGSPSMRMRPSVGVSRPAIMRSVVVFPQPEGPSRVTKPRSSINMFRSSTATNFSKRLVTCSSTICGMVQPPIPLSNDAPVSLLMTALIAMMMTMISSVTALPYCAYPVSLKEKSIVVSMYRA